MTFVPADFWPPGPPTGVAATDQTARDAAAAAQSTANAAVSTGAELAPLFADPAAAAGIATGVPAAGDTNVGVLGGILKKFAHYLAQSTWLGGLANEVTRTLAAHLWDMRVPVTAWGVKAAAVAYKNCTATGGSATIAAAAGVFSAAVVGWQASVAAAGVAYPDASSAYALASTITAVAGDGSSITLADTVVTSAAATTTTFGPDNTLALQRAHDAAVTTPTHGTSNHAEGGASGAVHTFSGIRLALPPGMYFVGNCDFGGASRSCRIFDLEGCGHLSRFLPSKGATYIVQVSRGNNFGYMNDENHHPGFRLANITFDGLGRSLATDAIRLDACDHFLIEKVDFLEVAGRAVNFYQSCREGTLRQVQARYCGNAATLAPVYDFTGNSTLEGHNNIWCYDLRSFAGDFTFVLCENNGPAVRGRTLILVNPFLHGYTTTTNYGRTDYGASARCLEIGNFGNVVVFGGRFHGWGRDVDGPVYLNASAGTGSHRFMGPNYQAQQPGGSPTNPAFLVYHASATAGTSVSQLANDSAGTTVAVKTNGANTKIWVDSLTAASGVVDATGPGGDAVRVADTRQGATAPSGSVTPDFPRQLYTNRTTGLLYMATGLGNTNWTASF